MIKDSVFQQILKPITEKLINECTTRFRSDHNYEKLTTDQHLKTMVYAHLTEIKSLRALETVINSQNIGIKTEIKRSTLSDANNKRTAACFFWILEQIMSLLPKKPQKGLNKFIKILDSTPIQLRGRGYDEWAKEFAVARCQGLKLHIEYDLHLSSPTRFATSHPNYNDCNMGQKWPIETNTIYVFDRGYYDFNWWWSIHKQGAFFVTRLKKKTAFLMEKNQNNLSESILEDGVFRLANKRRCGKKMNLYQEPLRRISVFRKDKNPLILVTNLHNVSPEIIAELYKSRWDIELFFKWVKQNLKLKKFLERSSNAVKIQLATALITYLLIQIFKDVSGNNRKLHLVLVWARYNLHVSNQKLSCHSPPPVYQFSRLSLINKNGGQL